jgi:alkanesulfonate monooxygenase SsuD/methylene tetrahydromethanopterin reductase-like flavin-dependent oxidoreductase (luciferase family)
LAPSSWPVRPLQQPYPPLWHPVSGVERAAWLGRHGINTVMHGEDYIAARDRLEAYAESWQKNRESRDRLNAHVAGPRFGLLKQVYLAEDRDQAIREARRAYELHGRAFLYLWDLFGEAERWASMKDFEGQMRSGGLLVGTPAEVRERLAEQLDATGANYVMANFSFGDMTQEQLLRSIGLFAKEIIPRIEASAATFRP